MDSSFLKGSLFYGLNLQKAINHDMIYFVRFHDKILCTVFGISILVLLILYKIVLGNQNKGLNLTCVEQKVWETVWTIFPAIILLFLAFPSLKLLYKLDGNWVFDSPLVKVKVVGRQWYWSYEIKDLNFDSFMIPSKELNVGDLRLLEVDRPLFLPRLNILQFFITSRDVIHCFSLPSFGVKCDAVPARLNKIYLDCYWVGSFYGQCSEICGANHRFMPIVLEIIK